MTKKEGSENRRLFVMTGRYKKNLKKALIFFLVAAVFLTAAAFFMRQHTVRAGMARGSSRIVSGESFYTRPDRAHLKKDEQTKIEYIDNELLAMKNGGVSEKEFRAYLEKNQMEIAGRIASVPVYQLRLKETYTYGGLEKIAKELTGSGMAKSAGPNITCGIVSGNRKDPRTPEGSEPAESFPSASWGLKAMGMERAWSLLGQTEETIRVGVLDTGFYTEHEDLVFAEPPLANALYDENGGLESHGTHVAGILAASADEKNGILGVIPQSMRSLYGASVFGMRIDRDRVDLMGLEMAFGYLIGEKRCKVVNLSLIAFGKEEMAAEMHGDNPNAKALVPRLEEFLEALLDRGYDFVICKAAGNQRDVDAACDPLAAIESPRVKDRILVVAAAARADDALILADYSSPGARVDLAAPGGSEDDLISTGVEQGIFGTLQSGFVGMSGTSMAAPYVSGTAALVWLADPELDGSQVKKILCDAADIPLENCSRWKMLDAAAAVETALTMND